MAKTDLLKERIVYKPFEYPKAFDFYMKQQQASDLERRFT
jgi:hypothetical protein